MCLKLYDGFVPMYKYMYYIQTKSCVIPHSLVVSGWISALSRMGLEFGSYSGWHFFTFYLILFSLSIMRPCVFVGWCLCLSRLPSLFSFRLSLALSLSPSLSSCPFVLLLCHSIAFFLSRYVSLSLPLSFSLFFLPVPLSFSLPDLFPPISLSFHPLFIHLSVRYSTPLYSFRPIC